MKKRRYRLSKADRAARGECARATLNRLYRDPAFRAAAEQQQILAEWLAAERRLRRERGEERDDDRGRERSLER